MVVTKLITKFVTKEREARMMFGLDSPLIIIIYVGIVIYFLILKPIGRWLKSPSFDYNKQKKEKRKEDDDKWMKEFVETDFLIYNETLRKKLKEKEYYRYRKKFLQYLKDNYTENGEVEKWEQMVKETNDILSKYGK